MIDAELLDRLLHVDELTLLELLNLDSRDLLDAFMDRIEEHPEKFYRYLNDF